MVDKLVSIVIPCRNEARHIEACIASVLAQEELDPSPLPSPHRMGRGRRGRGVWLEIIVADGMSEDGTREILQQLASKEPRVKLIENPERIVSAGLNAAIRAAQGKIIIRMDAHTEYAPDYVRRCVEVLEWTGADNVGGPARTKAAS